jgi:hypothetical protein
VAHEGLLRHGKKLLSEMNGNQCNLRHAFGKVPKIGVKVPALVLVKRAKGVCVKSQSVSPASSLLRHLRF